VIKFLATAILLVLAASAQAETLPQLKDDLRGPQWHFMDKSTDMQLLIRPWCVPNTPQWASCPHQGHDWRGWWRRGGLQEEMRRRAR
jgi:hypothetical protein